MKLVLTLLKGDAQTYNFARYLSLCHRETQSPCGLGGIGARADGVQRPGSKQ